MDNILLNYHDSLLYESDLELLNQGNWLNDRLIGFIYEYLERDEFEIECGERNRFSFVNPSTVQYLKLCESLNEASCCFLDPLCLDKKDVIFFPLNNNNETQVAGGSHWSLLVFYRKSHLLVHYDSTGSNRNEAVKFFRKYKDYFGLEEIQVEKEFPKQTNSSDCGVYLLAATWLIAQQLASKNANESSIIEFNEINQDFINNCRKKYKDLILKIKLNK